MEKEKVILLEDRLPKLKQQRKQKANRRFIAFLSVFFLLLIAIIYLNSPFSKVGEVIISGNDMIDQETILETSNIHINQSGFWNLKEATIENDISRLEVIKKVTATKKLLHTVEIQIDEYQVVGFVVKDNEKWPILENGQLLSEQQSQTKNGPIVQKWTSNEQLQELASQLIKTPISVRNSMSEISFSDKDPNFISIYMNEQIEVKVYVRDLSSQMIAYPLFLQQIVDEKGYLQPGVIDLQVGQIYTPLDRGNEIDLDNQEEGDGET
ncbi:FtsQ-type POTRA domain-containing protein [Bacillus carboniphilus]|uniref:Cell division protein DivIB n=1 Tax=Bacillus carboniphilus TaxID=86663 RepID=A0ABY9JYL0_9BACI|nr:FtsQ-type POTRA domain-containing protein [Bacillus carboniphilus]WLR43622.1 FtsQ-type POTRA domain-containing protein [Bacillus carboniphilus]